MNLRLYGYNAGRVVFYALAVAGLLLARPACAQDDGYHVGENQPTSPAPTATRTTSTAPRRLARVDYVSGNVTWRANDTANWAKAGRTGR